MKKIYIRAMVLFLGWFVLGLLGAIHIIMDFWLGYIETGVATFLLIWAGMTMGLGDPALLREYLSDGQVVRLRGVFLDEKTSEKAPSIHVLVEIKPSDLVYLTMCEDDFVRERTGEELTLDYYYRFQNGKFRPLPMGRA